MRKITAELIQNFKEYLISEEKSGLTVEKYIRDLHVFKREMQSQEIIKAVVLKYKQQLIEKYAPASVNSIISSLNSFFAYNEWYDCKVKAIKIQKQIFASSDKELTKSEYERLLKAAQQKKNRRLYFLMQTICATGIRVSELKFITVEAVKKEKADIRCKGKVRCVFLPKSLCQILRKYIREQNIKSGCVFITKSGAPVNRSNVWSEMKMLCAIAGVNKFRVFPHNLRHLFARTFYSVNKDIVRLADILGHSSVNTTRIYTKETGEIHRKKIQRLGLVHLIC